MKSHKTKAEETPDRMIDTEKVNEVKHHTSYAIPLGLLTKHWA